jgi:hypothetical protein
MLKSKALLASGMNFKTNRVPKMKTRSINGRKTIMRNSISVFRINLSTLQSGITFRPNKKENAYSM